MKNRREFLGGLLACGACGFWADPVLAASVVKGKPNLVFGVISDVHVTTDGMDDAARLRGNLVRIRKTFEWFRDQKVDAVMCCGDIADNGDVHELEAFAREWFAVFPDDRGADGRHVERLFIYGNHDSVGHNYGGYANKKYVTDEAIRANSIFFDPKGHWERIFREPYAPIFKKTVKGYTFIGQHWDENDDRKHGYKYYDHPRLGPFLAEHGKDLAGERPFFYFQHPQVKDSCYGPWAWGHDNGFTTKALSEYPNAVAFTGHSHYTSMDERAVWQGAFTSVGVSSLRYVGQPYSEHEPGGYANTGSEKGEDRWQRDAAKMSPNPTNGGQQGYLVSVYDDCLVIHRRDFMADLALGPDWVVPLPVRGERAFAFAERAKEFVAPQFPAGAKLSAKAFRGKTRGGRDKAGVVIEKVEKDALRLVIPAATAEEKGHPWEYAVEIESDKGAKISRLLLANAYCVPRAHERYQTATVGVFALDELPSGVSYKVTVTPRNCFGAEGRALVTQFPVR